MIISYDLVQKGQANLEKEAVKISNGIQKDIAELLNSKEYTLFNIESDF